MNAGHDDEQVDEEAEKELDPDWKPRPNPEDDNDLNEGDDCKVDAVEANSLSAFYSSDRKEMDDVSEDFDKLRFLAIKTWR